MKAFFSYYKPYKGLFFLDFGSAIVVGLLELIFPLITSTYIDRLLPTNQWNLIVIFGIALLFVFISTNPPYILFAIAFIYAVSGPILTLWQLRQRRRDRQQIKGNEKDGADKNSPE